MASRETSAALKEELDEELEVLQPMDIKYVLQPCKDEAVRDQPVQVQPSTDTERNTPEVSKEVPGPSTARKLLYKCDICNKSFIWQEMLHLHMEDFHDWTPSVNDLPEKSDKKRFSCEICKKVCNNEKSLKQHEIVHLTCYVCKKVSSSAAKLKEHILTHAAERPHRCVVCEKIFARSDNLRDHMLTHTNEKPYRCDICKKNFRHNYTLRHHLDRHIGETCSRAVKGHLERHVLIPKGETYTCRICRKSFNVQFKKGTNLNK